MMTCSRCGAQVTVERANYCAGCLLAAVDAEADASILSADEAPPCELLSVMGDTPRAVTFLAEQTWPVRRLVALKVFKTDVRRTEVPRHPNIAPVIERGRLGGRPYTVTPYLAGGSVIALSDRRRLDAAARLEALRSVLEGLAVAHGKVIAHGRIHASNVLCEPQAPFLVQLVDFDGPLPTEPTESFSALTRADLDALVALAEALLRPTAGAGVDLPAAVRKLRKAAHSAADLEQVLIELQTRLSPGASP